jgi:hypothetical protein
VLERKWGKAGCMICPGPHIVVVVPAWTAAAAGTSGPGTAAVVLLGGE